MPRRRPGTRRPTQVDDTILTKALALRDCATLRHECGASVKFKLIVTSPERYPRIKGLARLARLAPRLALGQRKPVVADDGVLPLQLGDVPKTYADVTALEKTINYRAGTNIAVGIQRFVDWYKDYYKV